MDEGGEAGPGEGAATGHPSGAAGLAIVPAPSPSTLHPKGAQHTLAIALSLNQLNANIKIILGNFPRGGYRWIILLNF